ncbi:uncharacterized protein LOC131248695 [Magnolia sinica]|uniref:uncharacterized protein LOC131248695 n=1 Tax=Magnolia sinica TaxID=86752 RepID=UPI00265B2A4C|nr:uncharacterized protein LOC131248695 [Magnolia sinica]
MNFLSSIRYIVFQITSHPLNSQIKPCGHGTLATSHFLFTSGLAGTDQIKYLTKAGLLTAKMVDGFRQLDGISRPSNHEVDKSFSIELNFPTIAVIECNAMEILTILRTLNGASVIDIMKTTSSDAIVVLSSGKAIADVQPRSDELRNCDANGVIMTGLAEMLSLNKFMLLVGILELHPGAINSIPSKAHRNWDPDLVKRIGAATALEVRTTGIPYVFAPWGCRTGIQICPGKGDVKPSREYASK